MKVGEVVAALRKLPQDADLSALQPIPDVAQAQTFESRAWTAFACYGHTVLSIWMQDDGVLRVTVFCEEERRAVYRVSGDRLVLESLSEAGAGSRPAPGIGEQC